MRSRHIGLVLWGLAVTISACSVALNWSQDGLPCEVDSLSGKYSCLAGYTCAFKDLNNPNENLCIADHSLAPNANCQADVQCVKNYACPDGTCLQTCDPNNAYKAPTGCPLGEYCKPFYTTSGYLGRDTPVESLEAACVPSDQCSVGNPCGTDNTGTCLAVNSAASACLLSCDVAFGSPTVASTFKSNCAPGQDGYFASCQAVGPAGGEITTCVKQYPAALAEGAACNNSIAQPCATGYTCWAGKCAGWCGVTSSPSSACRLPGQYCCPTTLTDQESVQLGYCVNGTVADCTPN